jgi:hypothetical protein
MLREGERAMGENTGRGRRRASATLRNKAQRDGHTKVDFRKMRECGVDAKRK